MNKWTEYLLIGAVIAIPVLPLLFLASHPGYLGTASDTTSSGFIPVGQPAKAPADAAIASSGFDGVPYSVTMPLERDITYSDFVADVEKDEVREVTIAGRSITGDQMDGTPFRTYAPDDPSLIEKLTAHRVTVSVAPASGEYSLRGLAIDWVPFFLLLGASIYFMRRMQSGRRLPEGFNRSRARLAAAAGRRVTFADVAGIDEARQELDEIVDFLKHPGKFLLLGGKMPKGCLLVGPPGTGKTLLARAIAGEANVPFYSVAGSEFTEIYVGVGASRMRDMFAEAKNHAPCIIFIDEIDAVGRHRGAGLGNGNDEREQTLNQLLVEMDGFDGNQGVIVIAATNRADVLDPALLRPGRFDRQVMVPNPDVAGRQQILDVHLRNVPVAADVDAEALARGTPGFSGADLANLVNEAALLAARKGAQCVAMAELEDAKEKALMGPERRSLVLTAEDRKRTAHHEAGHALVALHVPGNDPLHKVTIVPRGKALGVTVSLPEHDRHGFSRQEIEARLAMMFGGRVAEEIVYGADGVTTGAADDIRRATVLARRMVAEFGFNERLGPLHYAEDDEAEFLGQSITRHQHVSDATAEVVDQETRRIIDQAEAAARRVLMVHRDELYRLAQALLARETLSSDEIHAVLCGELSGVHGNEARVG